jgi:hypothetical protein
LAPLRIIVLAPINTSSSISIGAVTGATLF